jgi:2-haloacid dehalogenase
MATTKDDIIKNPPKALLFDVFGTVVNWRKTVTETLISSAQAKVASSSRSADLSPEIRRRLQEITEEAWGDFAQQWRNSYKKFVQGYKPDTDPWVDIDTHHYRSLVVLLKEWGLEGLYSNDEIEDLSKVWHFLEPWPEASAGLQKLGTKMITSTLSNGDQSLLKDLNEHGNLGFQLLQSSGDFKAYKPHPSTYLGGAKRVALNTGDVAMVAAHLGDLKAARDCGLKTIYVDRPLEEDWKPDSDEYREAQKWVDMFVTVDQDGFVEVARRFGIE